MGINPKQQTIDSVFGNTKYYIDFYQREYKWKDAQVESLLDDLFYKFEGEYDSDLDVNPGNVSKFGWYYLNTYVTNQYGGKMFIVDGQQRFTTLTLILIKLYYISKILHLKDEPDWIKSKIYGSGAEGKSFWVSGDSDDRKEALNDLLYNADSDNKTKDLKDSISIKNIYRNYKYISEYLDKKLEKSDGYYDKHKFKAFLIFFMQQIFLVEISISDSKDVPMVFEVINDRGEKLRPYEVFKGELIGQLEKADINKYYVIWKEQINKLIKSDEKNDEKEPDSFFKFYFQSKYVNNHNDYRDFDGEYNKMVFSKKWNKKINLKRNPKRVKEFINNDFKYYSDVYLESLEQSKQEETPMLFNTLNGQDRQMLLILSSIKLNDIQKNEKINLVSYLFDRHYALLQLFGCYDSNRFTETIIALNKNIRNKSLDEIKSLFDEQLINDIKEAKSISINSLFQYNLFKETNNSLGRIFLRYFFARIDHFIAENINLPTDNYSDMVKSRGFHIEHILADNDENKELFGDEETFYKERNRLGSLLLLKGRDNQSSNNEIYKEKIKTYSHGTLWARTLTEEFYHKNPDFYDFSKKYELDFRPLEVYDQSAIEKRQRLLFDIIKLIWGKIPE